MARDAASRAKSLSSTVTHVATGSGGSRISQGRQLPRRVRQPIILQFFAENCMKLKEFGPWGASLVLPWIRH